MDFTETSIGFVRSVTYLFINKTIQDDKINLRKICRTCALTLILRDWITKIFCFLAIISLTGFWTETFDRKERYRGFNLRMFWNTRWFAPAVASNYVGLRGDVQLVGPMHIYYVG